jgi:hypothetical protein
MPNVRRATVAFSGAPKELIPPIVVTENVALFTVPRLPLGDYNVSATLELAGMPAPSGINCGPLVFHITPPAGARLALFDFQPAGTRD